MEKKCRIWKSNSYDLDNIMDKKTFKSELFQLVQNLLQEEEIFYGGDMARYKRLADGEHYINYPLVLELEKFFQTNHSITSNELFNINKIKYNGNFYCVDVNILRSVDLFIPHISNSRVIKIYVTCKNNNDGIKYSFTIPYVYENKKALLSSIAGVYNTLLNLYKDYGH